MLSKKMIYLIFSILLIQQVSFTQSNNYLPLKVGNKWQYAAFWERHGTFILEVTKDTIINGKQHFYFTADNYNTLIIMHDWIRYDSTENKLYIFRNGNEYLHLKFNVALNDTFTMMEMDRQCYPTNLKTAQVISYEENSIYFNLTSTLIQYAYERCGGYSWDSYLKGLGITNIKVPTAFSSIDYKLIRAIVDGTSYTDNVKPIINITPVYYTNKYNLSIDAIVTHTYDDNYSNGGYFIKEAELQSIYVKGIDTIYNQPVVGVQQSQQTLYRFNFTLDSAKINSGYSFYYKIYAQDKGIIPEDTTTEYFQLQYSGSVQMWEKLNSGINNIPISSISFPRNDLGFATVFDQINGLSSFTLLKTPNMGDTWTSKVVNGLRFPSQIYFVNDKLGFISGYGDIGGVVLRTTNSGTSWTKYDLGAGGTSPIGINFINEKTGFIIARLTNGSILYKTTDGGNSWNNFTNLGQYHYKNIQFIDSLNGWISGAKLLKTTNGGQSFTPLAEGLYFNDVHFFDLLNGIGISASSGKIRKTTDGGQNWIDVNSPELAYNDLVFLTEWHGFAIGPSGTIVFTSDGGNNWESEQSTVMSDLKSVYTDGFNVWATGDNGTILRKFLIWVDVDEMYNNLTNDFELSQNYPNPFNPSTKIKYTIPKQGLVTIKVYDVLGKEIAQLINEKKNIGEYEVEFDGSRLSSGIYFYQIQAGEYLQTRKMVLMK
ncbi:MAG TPA: T9SS type A sorting domain-containing protein [Ignavibacteriaceae bacterium]|nr:T9SS type A sorting domain-containing protein [Ignavibacteriaceae bacterium]